MEESPRGDSNKGKKEKEKTERVRECMGHESCGERKEQEGRRKVGEGGRI